MKEADDGMGLEKATITNLETGERVSVMFNPEEYSLDLGNTFAEIAIPGLKTPPIQYVRGNIRNLKMELFFDTFEQKSDVRDETRKITSLLDKNVKTQAPPILLFSWGQLNFKCVLESAGQRFIMFLHDGTPVRAKLSVSFKEYEAIEIEIKHGLFIGPPTVRNVIEGTNLSAIAGEVLGDPGAWREIAELNNIDNPRKLEPGKTLIIPSRRR
ncbi:MAG: LysM peptidoglycan-binding domain-containing protein [Methanosarcina sp.]